MQFSTLGTIISMAPAVVENKRGPSSETWWTLVVRPGGAETLSNVNVYVHFWLTGGMQSVSGLWSGSGLDRALKSGLAPNGTILLQFSWLLYPHTGRRNSVKRVWESKCIGTTNSMCACVSSTFHHSPRNRGRVPQRCVAFFSRIPLSPAEAPREPPGARSSGRNTSQLKREIVQM
jgi:hypothetical protein